MPMTQAQFRQCLMLYGTDLDNWPEEVLAEALQVQHKPEFSHLVIEQQYFDELLFNNRHFEAASPDLAERIIRTAQARSCAPRANFAAWLQELLASLMPHPAFALVSVLALGIAIGLTAPAASHQAGPLAQAYIEEDGAIL